jgi:hypothetical protein
VRRLQFGDRHGQGRADAPLHHRHAQGPLHPRLGEATLSGVFVETDDPFPVALALGMDRFSVMRFWGCSSASWRS